MSIKAETSNTPLAGVYKLWKFIDFINANIDQNHDIALYQKLSFLN